MCYSKNCCQPRVKLKSFTNISVIQQVTIYRLHQILFFLIQQIAKMFSQIKGMWSPLGQFHTHKLIGLNSFFHYTPSLFKLVQVSFWVQGLFLNGVVTSCFYGQQGLLRTQTGQHMQCQLRYTVEIYGQNLPTFHKSRKVLFDHSSIRKYQPTLIVAVAFQPIQHRVKSIIIINAQTFSQLITDIINPSWTIDIPSRFI
uniref:Uncharacterized protein n=1 Tax=Riboviria sp. TaxID=2585031 RepID=A0A8K1U4G4_9VIRU|nr:MAG: hypothetical protein 3 [Riboviria sp.]